MRLIVFWVIFSCNQTAVCIILLFWYLLREFSNWSCESWFVFWFFFFVCFLSFSERVLCSLGCLWTCSLAQRSSCLHLPMLRSQVSPARISLTLDSYICFSGVMKMWSYCRRSEFSSQHPYLTAQKLSITLVPGGSQASGLRGSWIQVHIHT